VRGGLGPLALFGSFSLCQDCCCLWLTLSARAGGNDNAAFSEAEIQANQAIYGMQLAH
jgi:hypothetical protein